MKKVIYILLVVNILFLWGCNKERVLEEVDLGTSFILRRNGADMPVTLRGDFQKNIYVVWLHGGPGASVLQDQAFDFFAYLERELVVVYPEQRGQGMSQGHFSNSELNIWETAEDLKALARLLRKGYGEDIQLFLMGHSWGGTLGTAALLDPECQSLYDGWINMAGPHDSPLRNKYTVEQFNLIGQEQISEGNSVSYWENAIEEINAYDLTDIYDCADLNKAAFVAEDTLLADGVVADVAYDIEKYSEVSLRYDNYISNSISGFMSGVIISSNDSLFNSFSLSDSLSQIRIPTLMLWGENDFVVPPQLAQYYYDGISSDEKHMHIIEGAGHGVFAQQTEAAYIYVASFLELITGMEFEYFK